MFWEDRFRGPSNALERYLPKVSRTSEHGVLIQLCETDESGGSHWSIYIGAALGLDLIT